MYPKKTKHSGVVLRSSKTIQITMYFNGKRETETLTWDQTATNLKKCYELKIAAEVGYKNNMLNYQELFPTSNKHHKYVAQAGDSLTILQRFDRLRDHIKSKHKKNKLTLSTVNGYFDETDRLKNYFTKYHKDMRLSELTTDHLDKWVERRNVGNKTITEELKHIRSIIVYAKTKKQIPENILSDWKPETGLEVILGKDKNNKNIIKPKYKKHPFSRKEMNQILEAVKIIRPDHYSFVLFRFALGMRPSEIIGLSWKRYNEIDNSIYIKETVVKGTLVPQPKTPAGERPIALNKAATSAINTQKKLTYKDGGYIFTNPNANNVNGWWSEKIISEVWKKALIHVGLKHRRPYNTRHTCATDLLRNGEPILNVSELLGHNDMRTTMEAYAGGKREDPIKTTRIDDAIDL